MTLMLVGKGHMGQFLAKKLKAELYQNRIQQMSLQDLQKIDIVVNTAAKTDLSWCEKNPREAFEDNVECAVKLANLCAKRDIPMIQLSSGCIWKGPYTVHNRPFFPTTPADPACFYSWTKASAEGLLLQQNLSGMHILRPRQVYSAETSPRNTLWKLNSYEKLLDTPNSMTSISTIEKCISSIINNKDILWSVKVWNLYDIGVTSPYKVGLALAEAGLRKKPEKLEKEDLDRWHKPQRVDVVMQDKYMESVVSPPKIEQELKRMISAFARAKGSA